MRSRLKATKDKEVVVSRHLLQIAVMQAGMGRVHVNDELDLPCEHCFLLCVHYPYGWLHLCNANDLQACGCPLCDSHIALQAETVYYSHMHTRVDLL